MKTVHKKEAKLTHVSLRERQTDRQTDRQRQTETERDRERQTVCNINVSTVRKKQLESINSSLKQRIQFLVNVDNFG